jgi:hypothetical protein
MGKLFSVSPAAAVKKLSAELHRTTFRDDKV